MRTIIVFILLLGSYINISAQSSQFKFDYLTTADGLSTNRVRGVYRDSKNYVWIYSETGIDKYDGYHFKKYRPDKTQEGTLSSNDIKTVFEDSNNNLWVGTDKGLNLYNRGSDKFIVYNNNPKDTNTIDNDNITHIYEDSKGNLWVTTNGESLNKWNPNTKTFKRYSFDKKLRNIIIKEDSKGNLWMVSQSPGIMQFNPETKNLKVYNTPNQTIENGFKYILIDKEDKIWVAINGIGFFSFNPSTGKYEQYKKNKNGNGPNDLIFNNIIEEDDQHILLAIDQGGINRFNKTTKTFEYIVHNEKIDHTLNNNGIWSVYIDFEGILWVSTSGGGINYYNPKKYQFELFRHNLNNPNSVSSNIIGCFYEDSQGMIWIGTDDNGLDVYDPRTGDFKHYNHDPTNPYSISSNTIRCISEDKNNDVWIGTWIKGFNRFERETGKFFCNMPDKNDATSISGATIWHYLIDHKGVFWLAVHDVGVDLFDREKGVFKRFRKDADNPNALSNNKIWYIYEDNNKNIWLCTNNGLNLYDSINDNFIVYKNFPSNKIKSIVQNKDKNLWVGTEKGICLINNDGDILQAYNETDGLAGDIVCGTVLDNQGNLWVSTNNGISKFNPKAKTFKNYTQTDGLQDNAFFQQSFLKTRNGKIYFGGFKGFNSFYPDSLKNNNFIPPVYITDFKIFNEPVTISSPDSPLKKAIEETDEIILSWHQSVISFEFTAINYTYPEKNQYAYIMEGFEEKWNYVENLRQATYTNLDPGEYTLKVKASNNDGVWNENPTKLKIIILPPWWETWWFRTIIALVILGSAFLFYKLRVKALQQRQKILEDTVAKRTQELSDANARLEERQEDILLQQEEIITSQEDIEQKNTELNAQKEEIAATNDELLSKNKELDQAYHNIKILSDFGQKVTAVLDFKNISNMVYEYFQSMVDISTFGIGIYNERSQTIEFSNFIENNTILPYFKKSLNDKTSMSVKCFINKEAVIQNSLSSEYKSYLMSLCEYNSEKTPNSMINLPLIFEGKATGVITASSLKENAYSDRDVTNLRTLASYISIALDNAKSYQLIKIKNDAISGSIRYGKTIQQAFLPSKEYINDHIDNFVLFRPKDIVSGDFYWFSAVTPSDESDLNLFAAAVDCTGHGVPGAFMSMIGMNLLKEIIHENQIWDPAEILEELHKRVVLALKQDETDNNDGMDVCLICIKKTKNGSTELKYSGAKRSLIYADCKNKTVHKLDATRRSIGGTHSRGKKPDFQSYKMKINQDMVFYLSSDGFTDQCNPLRKKIGTKKVVAKIQEIMHLPLHEQKTVFDDMFDKHMDTELQRDDVTLLGIRLKG